MRVLQSLRLCHLQPIFSFGPFNSSIQRRWKKPVDSAQTRLEDRTRDAQLDKVATQIRKLNVILKLHDLMSQRKRGPFVSVQIMSRWRHLVGINIGIGEFLHKVPHVFDLFTHPVRRNLCCRFTDKMLNLVNEEENVVRKGEMEAVRRVKKLLMMSVNGKLRVHALRLVRRELGLPEDFRESILSKYSKEFKLVDLEVVELVGDVDEELGLAEIEKWREKEYREKWLSEFETKYAFPISFPTGYKIESGYRDKLKNWQRLPFVKPYETKEVARVRSCGGIERYEKRAVGILHEFLCLTVEKMVEVERLAHFQRDFSLGVNVRELLLKHPGIFYISTKGSGQRVFLREGYSKGCLVEPNRIYVARRNILHLILVGFRYTRELNAPDGRENNDNVVCGVKNDVKGDEDWIIPMLERLNHENTNDIVLKDIE